MPTFMKVDERSLISDLQTAVVEIFFEKKDGSNRLMKATLQKAYFAQPLTESGKQERANFLSDGDPDPTKIKVLHVWDVDEHAWRSVRLDRIITLQLTGG
jgi:hypothetical protein